MKVRLLLLLTGIAVIYCLAGNLAAEGGKKAEAATEEQAAWPRSYDYEGAKIVLYQPQVDSWKDELLKARMAFAVTLKNEKTPFYGAMWLACRTETNMDDRTVTLYKTKIEKINIPGHGEKEEKAKEVISSFFPKEPRDIALEEILESVNRQKIEESRRETALGSTIPAVYVTYKPTLVLQIDGKPQFKNIAKSSFSYVFNTGWLILVNSIGNEFYAYAGNNSWFKAAKIDSAKWQPMAKEPDGIADLAGNKKFKKMKADVDDLLKDEPKAQQVIASTKPAVAIEFNGKPSFKDISGTTLKIADNSEETVILDPQNKTYYSLFSGRWLKNNKLNGSWTLVKASELPVEFKKIPDDDQCGYLLPHIPGTAKAQEARIVSQIPVKATVNKKNATLSVTYNGKPVFEPIKGTNLTYAVNTEFAVINCEGRYYCCFNGVWFVGENAQGPWQVADKVPDAIYSIPPESPLYYVTYVKIYESSDDQVVSGYTSGYMNEYVDNGGVVVYGTGYYYRPYCYRGVYYYRRPTWGIYVGYHPYYGGYVYRSHRMHPCHYRAHKRGYYYSRGWYGRSRTIYTPYGRWSKKAVTNGSYWATSKSYKRHRKSVTAVKTSRGNKAVVARKGHKRVGVASVGGDVYVGKDGNIYRRDGKKSWQSYNGKGWIGVSGGKHKTATGTTTRHHKKSIHHPHSGKTGKRVSAETAKKVYSNRRLPHQDANNRSRSHTRRTNYNSWKRSRSYSSHSTINRSSKRSHSSRSYSDNRNFRSHAGGRGSRGGGGGRRR